VTVTWSRDTVAAPEFTLVAKALLTAPSRASSAQKVALSSTERFIDPVTFTSSESVLIVQLGLVPENIRFDSHLKLELFPFSS